MNDITVQQIYSTPNFQIHVLIVVFQLLSQVRLFVTPWTT